MESMERRRGGGGGVAADYLDPPGPNWDAFSQMKESSEPEKKKTLADFGEIKVYLGVKTESSRENVLNSWLG